MTVIIKGDLDPPPDGELGAMLLLRRAVFLQRGHNAKVAKYLAEHPDYNPECGILTREACYLAGLLSRLQRCGITPEQINELANDQENPKHQAEPTGRVGRADPASAGDPQD